jgi:two-component system response regulator HydG
MTQPPQPSVLVVDDNKELAENIAEILSEVGVKVGIARDAESALEAFDEREWSLVVTDMRMPKVDGLELLALLKDRRPSTPILLMTGFADPDTVARAAHSGALGVVHKPIDLDELIVLVERISEAQFPVLIVEDDIGLCSNLIEILAEQRGFLPHPATNVALARRLAKQIDFGMVLLDLRLPDGDGLSLAHELRVRPDGSLRPMVFMTGFPEDIEGIDSGAHEIMVLTKPFSVAGLIERLRAMMPGGLP